MTAGACGRTVAQADPSASVHPSSCSDAAARRRPAAASSTPNGAILVGFRAPVTHADSSIFSPDPQPALQNGQLTAVYVA